MHTTFSSDHCGRPGGLSFSDGGNLAVSAGVNVAWVEEDGVSFKHLFDQQKTSEDVLPDVDTDDSTAIGSTGDDGLRADREPEYHDTARPGGDSPSEDPDRVLAGSATADSKSGEAGNQNAEMPQRMVVPSLDSEMEHLPERPIAGTPLLGSVNHDANLGEGGVEAPRIQPELAGDRETMPDQLGGPMPFPSPHSISPLVFDGVAQAQQETKPSGHVRLADEEAVSDALSGAMAGSGSGLTPTSAAQEVLPNERQMAARAMQGKSPNPVVLPQDPHQPKTALEQTLTTSRSAQISVENQMLTFADGSANKALSLPDGSGGKLEPPIPPKTTATQTRFVGPDVPIAEIAGLRELAEGPENRPTLHELPMARGKDAAPANPHLAQVTAFGTGAYAPLEILKSGVQIGSTPNSLEADVRVRMLPTEHRLTSSMRPEGYPSPTAGTREVSPTVTIQSNLAEELAIPVRPIERLADRQTGFRLLRQNNPSDQAPRPITAVQRDQNMAPMVPQDVNPTARGEFASENPGGSSYVSIVTGPGALNETVPPVFQRAETPVHVARQIAEALQNQAERPVELRLNPEELGRVRMTLQASEDSMKVLITVERPETLALMRKHIDLLGQEFQRLGYSGTQFTFAEQQGNDPGMDQRSHANEPPQADLQDVENAEAKDTARPQLIATSGVDLRL